MKRLAAIFSLALALPLGASEFFERLVVGEQVYEEVYVLSANASSLSIRHRGGLSQVELSRLEPELQSRYGYQPAAAAERAARLTALRERQVEAANERLERKLQVAAQRRGDGESAPQWLKAAFAQFGRPPRLAEEVDLRPAFRGHGIGVRTQRGPSCSVHAVVAALEFQYAEKQGRRVDISEPFLVEATSRILGRPLVNALRPDGEPIVRATRDEGFALEHVFQAIRGHGLVLDRVDGKPITEEVFAAFSDVNFSPFPIPGGRSEVGIGNIAHVLNAGMPVVVGVGWPTEASVRQTSLLSKQPALEGAGHAVTIVGYRCPTGKLEDAKFIFRNSWGYQWGAGGYGFFTYEYLASNLFSCYVVELR